MSAAAACAASTRAYRFHPAELERGDLPSIPEPELGGLGGLDERQEGVKAAVVRLVTPSAPPPGDRPPRCSCGLELDASEVLADRLAKVVVELDQAELVGTTAARWMLRAVELQLRGRCYLCAVAERDAELGAVMGVRHA